jgi:hypothetical protein
MKTPRDAHEWMSFDDKQEDRTWLFDVTFLLSNWQCIYGAGCQGVYTEAAPELAEGCCTYGAHFVDAEDVRRVENAAMLLTSAQWQFKSAGKKHGVTKRVGKETTTRLAEGACIFLNRPGFEGGPGCALHRAALETGVSPLRLKPDVCWQLPLRREDSVDDKGHVTSTITEWRRRHWGEAGDEFHWWCTEEPAAFVGAAPVYESLSDELVELVGKDVFKRVKRYLDDRRGQSTWLPHPTVRKVPTEKVATL